VARNTLDQADVCLETSTTAQTSGYMNFKSYIWVHATSL